MKITGKSFDFRLEAKNSKDILSFLNKSEAIFRISFHSEILKF